MSLDSKIMKEWVNPIYLDQEYVNSLIESVKAKPETKYIVLDNFFVTSKFDELINSHQKIDFLPPPEPLYEGQKVMYDANSVHAEKNPDQYFGSDFMFSTDFHDYISNIVGIKLDDEYGTQVRLRSHKPDANGFWIHTDKYGNGTPKYMVALAYFNKDWKALDGGLLQLWRLEETDYPDSIKVNPNSSLELLNNVRIRAEHVGGNLPDNKESADMVMIDQIVPSYNRLVLINFQDNPAYHSVSPSHGKTRQGFVLWLTKPKNKEEV
jgi:Rps23 Pro-64 3,4-dihydroxylase Tpa1-like proline 4-hydroxylase